MGVVHRVSCIAPQYDWLELSTALHRRVVPWSPAIKLREMCKAGSQTPTMFEVRLVCGSSVVQEALRRPIVYHLVWKRGLETRRPVLA